MVLVLVDVILSKLAIELPQTDERRSGMKRKETLFTVAAFSHCCRGKWCMHSDRCNAAQVDATVECGVYCTMPLTVVVRIIDDDAYMVNQSLTHSVAIHFIQ